VTNETALTQHSVFLIQSQIWSTFL